MSATTSRQSAPAVARRSYTSVCSFGLAFFNYSYGMNSQTLVEQGLLTQVGTSADCPPGRVLYENGKKIVPVQGNFPPILITTDGTSAPLSSYMVGVFDPQSGLNGFIDPNSVAFAINSTDKPAYLTDRVQNGPATNINNSGNPVVTNGSVLSIISEGNNPNETPIPNYVGIAAPGVDLLNFPNGGIYAEPYALSLFDIPSNIVGEGDNNEELVLGMATGEGYNNGGNWAGMYADGSVYHTGGFYARRNAGTTSTFGGAGISVFAGRNYNNSTALVFLSIATIDTNFSGAGQTFVPPALTYTLTTPSDTTGLATLTINPVGGQYYTGLTVNWFIVQHDFDITDNSPAP